MNENNDLLKRYERKWVFNTIDHNQLFILLNRSNFFFSNQFTDRQVNSIYFDDEHYTSIKQNIEGISEKKKYRLRWYGDFRNIKNPTFEIKAKKGFEVIKKNFVLPNNIGKDLSCAINIRLGLDIHNGLLPAVGSSATSVVILRIQGTNTSRTVTVSPLELVKVAFK